MTRSDVTFSSDGTACAAWLYRPAGAGDLVPLVVMAHGFSATRDCGLPAYAERFATAGLGVLLYDYRHFGASGGEPRQMLDIGRQQADYHAAIAYARGLDWVDGERIALFGSSFSGGHALAVGAADPRIAAVVIQGPFTDGIATLPGLGVRNLMLATAAGLRDQLGSWRGRKPHYVPAVGPAGTFAVMATPDAAAGFASIVPAETTWENRVAARILLRIATYRPGRAAAKLGCPLHVTVCDHDSLCPADRTVALCRRAPRARIDRQPIGHFDVYTGEPFERAVAAQTAFLREALGLGRPGASETIGAAGREPAGGRV